MPRLPVEIRVTAWVNVEDNPLWATSNIAAYRIWIEKDGLRWYQCHEWEYRHGNRERWAEGWIHGVRGWGSAQPTEEEPPE